MHAPFKLNERDLEFYQTYLKDFLPSRITDIHAHVWLKEFEVSGVASPQRAVTWTSLVAADNSIADLRYTYDQLFPDSQSQALVFGFPSDEWDIDLSNNYVSREAESAGFFPLMLSRPEWTAADFSDRLQKGRFLGAKVYLNFADPRIPGDQIRIFDFIPHHQLEVLDSRRAILILHIPRPGRLKDEQNLADLVEIDQRYPNISVVVAHVGRAYCDGDVGDAFAVLEQAPGLLFDISANTNSSVFEQAIRAVGSERLMFGTDLPITRMRMKRICRDGRYVNLVPPGLYGDVTTDPNMDEVSEADAPELTLFVYEEVDAFRRAAERCDLTTTDIEAVFQTNASKVLSLAQRHYTDLEREAQ